MFVADCLFPFECFSDSPHPSKQIYKISRHLQYSFSLKNKTNKIVRNVHFWVYAPVKQTPSQRCDKLESSLTHETIIDEYNNQILHYVIDIFAPYASKVITIDAYLKLSDYPNAILEKNINEYLIPEKYIETDNPAIINTAQQLKKNMPVETVQSISQWIVDNLKCPGYILNERGALYALNFKQGDCTEYMYLFAALSRANGIPTRCLGGYVCSQNEILKFSRYHNWAEFYHEGTWRLADPHKNTIMKNQSYYIAFKILKNSHLNPISDYSRFHVQGSGISAVMN